jgi:hypothetical protein
VFFLPGFGWGGRLGRRRQGRAALDANFESAFDLGVEMQLHFVFAEHLDRLFKVYFPFVERDVELSLELLGDHSGSDRAKHLAVLARLHSNNADQVAESFGEFAHGVELVRLTLGPALLQSFDLPFVGLGQRNRKALREEIIPGVACRHLHAIGLSAQTDDAACENNFSFHVER